MGTRPTFETEALPDSPYARELRRGFPGLRFTRGLESEFRLFHLARVQWRARIWQLLTLLLGVTSLVRRHGETGGSMGDAEMLLRLAVLLPCALVLAWAAWSRLYERVYPLAMRLVVPVFYATATFLVAKVVAEGRTEALLFVAISMLAAFFLIGLLLRQAVLCCALMIAAFAAGAVVHGLPPALLGRHLQLLVVIGLVGCLVHYGIERANRVTFLQGRLMGELASRDGLTGLDNRRSFDEHLVSVWQQALRDRRSMAVLLIDVDAFKAYNDLYGHQAGDEALRRISQVVRGFARRPFDTAARYGGEELAVIFYDLAEEHVRTMAEQLRAAVQALAIAHRDSPPAGVVTVSIGAALARPALDRSPQGVVQLADEALYAAKRAGRNCVRVFDRDQIAAATGQFRRRAGGGA